MATPRPHISEASIHSDAMTGKVLRQLREQLGMTQKQLAPLVGLSRSSLHHREARNSVLPVTVAASAMAIAAAKHAGELSTLPHKTKLTWRESIKFKVRPPFQVLPTNGVTCKCGDPGCGLKPVRDDDWTDHGHLWIFQGWRCYKRVYLDAGGQKVPPPRREPVEVCRGCGRSRELHPRHSTRLGEKYWTTVCRPRPDDSPSMRHDTSTYWWKRNGNLEPLPPKAIEKLHGRSKRSFPAPTCAIPGCPRHGMTMPISNVPCVGLRGGGECQIAIFRCLAPKPHTEYRILPRGEVAKRIAMGVYRWTDKVTNNDVETVRQKRPVHPMRVMPSASCPGCGTLLRQSAGPWKLQGRRRRWNAECTSCQTIYRVRNDGEITDYKDSRWFRDKRGLVAGTTIGDTDARITVAASLEETMAPAAMARHLYPKQMSKDHARHNTVVFLGRRRNNITLERTRLAALSETQREVEIEIAIQRLNSLS